MVRLRIVFGADVDLDKAVGLQRTVRVSVTGIRNDSEVVFTL